MSLSTQSITLALTAKLTTIEKYTKHATIPQSKNWSQLCDKHAEKTHAYTKPNHHHKPLAQRLL